MEAKFRGRFCQVQQVNVKEKNYKNIPRGTYQVIQKVLSNFHNKITKKKICHETKKIQFGRDSVSTLQSIQKSLFWSGNFSGNSFSNLSFRECFGKTMPRAFEICYLKSLCIFPNELKLQPKIPQISRKCLEAKFRGRFRQVQQVKVKEKYYGQFPGVFIKSYKKYQY